MLGSTCAFGESRILRGCAATWAWRRLARQTWAGLRSPCMASSNVLARAARATEEPAAGTGGQALGSAYIPTVFSLEPQGVAAGQLDTCGYACEAFSFYASY